jgi:hypothetical protein
MGLFCPPGSDPLTRLNPDPIRIRNPDCVAGVQAAPGEGAAGRRAHARVPGPPAHHGGIRQPRLPPLRLGCKAGGTRRSHSLLSGLQATGQLFSPLPL